MTIDRSRFKDTSKPPPRKVKYKGRRCWHCDGRGLRSWFIGEFYHDYGSGWSRCWVCKGSGDKKDEERR